MWGLFLGVVSNKSGLSKWSLNFSNHLFINTGGTWIHQTTQFKILMFNAMGTKPLAIGHRRRDTHKQSSPQFGSLQTEKVASSIDNWVHHSTSVLAALWFLFGLSQILPVAPARITGVSKSNFCRTSSVPEVFSKLNFLSRRFLRKWRLEDFTHLLTPY